MFLFLFLASFVPFCLASSTTPFACVARARVCPTFRLVTLNSTHELLSNQMPESSI